MSLKTTFAELGKASPLALAAGYGGILLLVNIIGAIWPAAVLSALLVIIVWLAASVGFFIVVAWYRDEDWLAAGFLLGVPSILSGLLAAVVVEAVRVGSIAPLIVGAPTAFLALLVRGIIVVPLFGGAVALARWITARWKQGAR